jgi:hypothetical protein
VWAKWGDTENGAQLACTTNGATWTSGFAGVWHLEEAMTDEATSGTNRDSTANHNAGAQNGNDDSSGKVGGGQDFDGANDWVNCGNNASLTIAQSLTLGMWINPDTLATWDVFCGKLGGAWSGYGLVITSGTSLRFIIDYYSYGNAYVETSQFSTGDWQYFVGVYDYSTDPKTLQLYRNGTLVASNLTTRTVNNPGGSFCLGCNGDSSNNTDGKLDEVRVSTAARSANWVWAEWMNMASNGVFLSYGPAQGSGGVDAYGIPDAWKIQYFGSATGPNTGALDDWDHDGMNNLGEYGAGTCPADRLSLLKISGWQPGAGSSWVLDWLSVSGRTYTIRGTTNLLLGFPEVVSNYIAATPDTNSCVLPIGQVPRKFYRVLVE